MDHNIILMADSYKYSMWNQYPEGTEYVYSYIESRGGKWEKTVFFGLQAFIQKYLTTPITKENIDEAEELITAHGEPFYREGWEHILNEHDGFLPVKIRAVPEGSVVPVSNVLVDIINTDPKAYWLTSFLETILLQAVWYPTTVATNSYESKKIIMKGLIDTGTPELIDFKLHDFGFRGVSSVESAGIGAAAHLINFMGTDTIPGIQHLRKYYGADMAGFSIPAMEHSTVTSWGRQGEVDSYRNMIKKNAKPGGLVSAVSDSYDIFKACELWGTELKQDVLDSGATLVVRPDSGDPADVVTKCLRILDKHFGHTVNEKGYKVLNNVRVIQGDGINHASIRAIIYSITLAGYSVDNVNFGQGGALLQAVDRDTMKWAMKCSAICVKGSGWRDVQKDPITDPGKRSKKGLLDLVMTDDGYKTVPYAAINNSEMDVVFENGEITRYQKLHDIRNRANAEFV